MASTLRRPLILCLACGAPCAAQVPPGIQSLLQTQPLSGGPDNPGWIFNGPDIYYSGGKVGIGVGFPVVPLHVATTGDRALAAQSTTLLGISYGGVFTVLSPDGRAVYGLAAA